MHGKLLVISCRHQGLSCCSGICWHPFIYSIIIIDLLVPLPLGKALYFAKIFEIFWIIFKTKKSAKINRIWPKNGSFFILVEENNNLAKHKIWLSRSCKMFFFVCVFFINNSALLLCKLLHIKELHKSHLL